MKRTPLRRSGPLRRGSSRLRRTPLRSVSARSANRAGERSAAVEQARATHGERCCAGYLGKCLGPVHGHELIARSRWAEGKYVAANIVPLCNLHNGWVEDNPAAALLVGLRVPWHPGGLAETLERLGENAEHRRNVEAVWPIATAELPAAPGLDHTAHDYILWRTRYCWSGVTTS